MKYFIAYKQDENTYLYVTSISTKVETTMFYANALDFITYNDAKNIANFLNESDSNHEYIVIKYEYSLEEV